jgi:hypothetical protein
MNPAYGQEGTLTAVVLALRHPSFILQAPEHGTRAAAVAMLVRSTNSQPTNRCSSRSRGFRAHHEADTQDRSSRDPVGVGAGP